MKTSQIVLQLPEDATGVRVEIDGEPIHAALVGAAILVSPGARRVVVAAENYAARFEATVQAETSAVVELRAELGRKRSLAVLRSSAPARQALPSAPAPGPRISPVVVAGTAAALVAGAVVTGAMAYDVRHSFLKKNENPAPGSLGERQALHDRGQALAVTSTVLTGAAVTAGGFAAYPSGPRPPRPRLLRTPPGGGLRPRRRAPPARRRSRHGSARTAPGSPCGECVSGVPRPGAGVVAALALACAGLGACAFIAPFPDVAADPRAGGRGGRRRRRRRGGRWRRGSGVCVPSNT